MLGSRFAQFALQAEDEFEGLKALPTSVKRKHVHWTHGRSSNPEHVQPDALSREEFWAHLAKCYTEAYPRVDSPTGSILAFGLVAQEPYSSGNPSAPCPVHKHCPTISVEQHYWSKVASLSLRKYNVKLNAVAHQTYGDMFRYVREPSSRKRLHQLDATPFFSQFHPVDQVLAEIISKTDRAAHMRGGKRDREGGGGSGGGEQTAPKRKRLRVYDLVKEHGVKTVEDMLMVAHGQDSAGDSSLAEYCTRNEGKLEALITSARRVLEAPARQAERHMTLMQKLARGADQLPCICASSGDWEAGALRILALNNIRPDEFARAVCEAFQLGACRGSNIALIGKAGCGKSMLIEPLQFVFKTCGKPQRGSTFPLKNAMDAEILLWQDYRHHEGTLSWTDLLSFFVRELVEVRVPGTSGSGGNVPHRNAAPTFYSGRAAMKYVCEDNEDPCTV